MFREGILRALRCNLDTMAGDRGGPLDKEGKEGLRRQSTGLVERSLATGIRCER